MFLDRAVPPRVQFLARLGETKADPRQKQNDDAAKTDKKLPYQPGPAVRLFFSAVFSAITLRGAYICFKARLLWVTLPLALMMRLIRAMPRMPMCHVSAHPNSHRERD